MNIRDLKYFVSLADHRHFGKAAQECFVSQPALSIQIKKLEEFLGVDLLERTNKSVMLTNAGKILVEHARRILHQTEEMRSVAKSVSDPYGGELKIGIFPTLAPYLLPYIIPPISKSFPKLEIYLVEEKSTLLIENLKNGKIDAVIFTLPISDNSFCVSELFNEEFLLAVPNKHPLSKKTSIKPEVLFDYELLLLEDGHCLREQALAFCQNVSAQENPKFRATSLETLRHMVAAGVGVTLIPKLACKPSENISYVPFKTPKPFRKIGLLWRKESARNKVLEEMSSQIKNIMKNITKLDLGLFYS